LPETPGEIPAPQGFMDRYGDTVASCVSAGAAGVAIYLSGGAVVSVAGAFALNSSLLCFSGIGKLIANDAWREFEKEGGTGYKVWLTTETLLTLIDICGGIKGGIVLLRTWSRTIANVNRLEKLKIAVKGKKLTKRELLEIIRQIDPSEAAKIGSKAPRYRVIGVGQQVLKAANFVNVTRERAKPIVDAIGAAATVYGDRGVLGAGIQTCEVWLLNYDQPAQLNP
jgi:hypothetical protein